MADNQVDESTDESAEPGAFEKLETASDHDDRAKKLRAEAKRDVLDGVAESLPFDAEIAVKLKGGAFEVTCTPKGLADSIEEQFDQEVEVSSPFRFTVGEMELSERERIKSVKHLIGDIEEEYDDGAPVDVLLERANEIGMDRSKLELEIDKLKQKGEVYEPSTDTLRTT